MNLKRIDVLIADCFSKNQEKFKDKNLDLYNIVAEIYFEAYNQAANDAYKVFKSGLNWDHTKYALRDLGQEEYEENE